MAVSGVYLFGAVSEQTRSGAPATSKHLSLSNPIKDRSKEARRNKLHSEGGGTILLESSPRTTWSCFGLC